MMRKVLLLSAAAWLAALSCSNVNGPPSADGGQPAYFPNGDGSRWTYRYQRYFNNVPSGEPYYYDEYFEGTAVVDGVEAQRLVRAPRAATAWELSYVADDDENTVLLYGREFYTGALQTEAVYFEPPWSALVYPLTVNRSWSEVKQEGLTPAALGLPADLDGDGADDAVDVEIVCKTVTKEDLTLPIEMFPDCYKVRRTVYATFHMTTGGDVEETYVRYGWFKPGRGYVQYTGDEITVPNAARYTYLVQLEAYELAR